MAGRPSLPSRAALAALALIALVASGCEPTTPAGPTNDTAGSSDANHCGSMTSDQAWTSAVVYRLTCTVTVEPGATLTIDAGTVVKAKAGAQLMVNGKLLAKGTKDQPVVFTSINDNTVGGNTGTGTPTTSDWPGIAANNTAAVAHLDNVRISHAAVGIDAQTGNDLRVTGTIVRDAIGARTIPWNQGMALFHPILPLLDARNVDWGSPSGPAPMGTGTPISGNGVMTLPYAGFEMPGVPDSVPQQPAPQNSTCTTVTILGLRGSNEPPRSPSNDPNVQPAYPDEEAAAGWVTGQFAWGWANSVNQRPTATKKIVGIQYPALMIPEVAGYHYPDSLRSVYYGGVQLRQFIGSESGRCPDTRFIVVGYSQGAAAARMGLAAMDQAADPLLAKVAGVVLVGDPSKPANDQDENLWEATIPSFQNWTQQPIKISDPASSSRVRPSILNQLAPDLFPAFSPALAKRTWNACHTQDLMCAPGPGSTFNAHMNYTSEDPFWAGYAVGDSMASTLP